ncbi:MAG TPA: glycosyltransferase, partial [Bacteroidales bacterium]|nr:glycosyltransferase [Bacteroidales bacterium]
MRVIFFIESLQAGGKERRAAELIRYLKDTTDYEVEIVLTEAEIHFDEVLKMGIKVSILKRRSSKYDPSLFSRFLTVCRAFKPDIIHTWGKMTTFYAIPAKLILRVPLVANLVSDTSGRSGRYSFYSLLKTLNIFFSDSVLSNSIAGLKTYRINTPKARVIYNGVRLSRFSVSYDIQKIREELDI